MSNASFDRAQSINNTKQKQQQQQQQRRFVEHNPNVLLSSPQHRRRSSFASRVLSSRLIPTLMILVIITLIQISDAFVINNQHHTFKIIQQNILLHHQPSRTSSSIQTGVIIPSNMRTSSSRSSSALLVWWYGGSESVESNMNSSTDDSCELVAVRIERTSPNSRRIFGDITINAPIQDVWSILTDYNRLAIHVPNLVESKIERPLNSGSMGDGQYQCRLYQKGAQKIIGFEFGASVTMDMKEVISIPFNSIKNGRQSNAAPASLAIPLTDPNVVLREERKILFKCVDSFFFREFDGEWKVQEFINLNTGTIETLLSYVVDVRPKGPVPVAALEWRIREDVPTNLRAVKKSALSIQQDDVLMSKRRALQQQQKQSLATDNNLKSSTKTPNDALTTFGSSKQPQDKKKASTAKFTAFARDARTKIQWLQDETMAAYLTDTKNT